MQRKFKKLTKNETIWIVSLFTFSKDSPVLIANIVIYRIVMVFSVKCLLFAGKIHRLDSCYVYDNMRDLMEGLDFPV